MFERRLQVLLIILGVVCLTIVVRAFSLQVVGRQGWTKEAENNLTDSREIPTVRGRILDIKGRELAIDTPCTDVCVHFQAVSSTPDLKWLQSVARGRVKKRVDNYTELPLAERKKLLAAEVDVVKHDIDTMWHDLAVLSGTPEDELDDLRRQIERRVEVQRRLLWYAKSRATTQAAEPAWYAKLLGGGPSEPDVASVRVSEERDVHIVLPNISSTLGNELRRRIARYPGLVLRQGVLRTYPADSAAAQTIGRIAKVTPEDLVKDPRQGDKLGKYAATDDIGREGLEKMLEQQLRGTRGRMTNADEDANADEENARPVLRDVAPVPGQDVTVTLDIELQRRVEQAFRTVQFTVNAQQVVTQEMNGAAVVIDVPTGEVRAMASWPTYDLNKFKDNISALSADRIGTPTRNRATQMQTEPGSTVKPLVGIAAISAGYLRPDETIHCDGYLYINGRRMPTGRCWTMRMHDNTHQTQASYPHLTGDLTFPEALQRSCNVFHETLAHRMGSAVLSEWFAKFGLGRPTGVGVAEYSGILPGDVEGPVDQRVMATCIAGIGEGMTATPMQMANAVATIARNGVALRPTLRAGEPRERVDLHFSQAALDEAHAGMDAVVNTMAGTGRASVWMPDIHVAAKTGSAQTTMFRLFEHEPDGRMKRDARGRLVYTPVMLGRTGALNPEAPWYRATGKQEDVPPAHGWMIGYAPAEHPKIAFCVLVEFGGSGSAAGGVVKQTLEACKELGYLE